MEHGEVVGDVSLELRLVQRITMQLGLPGARFSGGVLLLDVLDSLLHFFRARRGCVPTLRLLAQQFLVNQTVEGTAAVLVGQLIERAPFYERFETDGGVPLAWHNDMAGAGRANAVKLRRGAR